MLRLVPMTPQEFDANLDRAGGRIGTTKLLGR